MKTKLFYFMILLLSAHLIYSQSDEVRLNDIRILASHNSYKKLPNKRVLHFLSCFKKRLGQENDPIQLDYGHVSIEEQLEKYNVRGFELDIYYDPKGKLYRKRKINRLIVGQKTLIKNKAMNLPGFKVLHIPDIDFETNYLTFTEALNAINYWSEKNPLHSPIFINVEAKGSSAADESSFLRFIGFKRAIKFDSLAYLQLDAEIKSIFPMERIITPRILRSDFTSIDERLTEKGWPALNECLGKIVFILQGNHDEIYKQSIDRNDDRVMFVYAEPGEKNTAFIIRNSSKGIEKEIYELSKKYIVRSRTDAGTHQSRNNDYSDYQSVLKSNAQIISTDYYKADLRWSSFEIKLDGTTKTKPFLIRN
ncbi:MAG: Ca2+-dependent phosphoinositide-specific phospholipase C [Bacteroidota bacterium]